MKHFILLLTMSVIFSACTRQNQVDRSHEILSGLPSSTVILEVNGKSVTASDIAKQMTPKIERTRDQLIQEYRDEALEHAYQNLLIELSKKNGVSDVSTYLNDQKSKIEVTDAEVIQFLKQNKISNLSKEQAKKFLIEQLWITRQNEIKNNLLSQAKIEWKLSPSIHSIAENDQALSKGAEKYSAKLDVFCDFTNPLCSSIRLGIEQILMRHPKEVRVFFHPLPHTEQIASTTAAMNALCAGSIHQFWKAYDALFNAQTKLTTVDNIKQVVDSIGFSDEEKAKIQKCLKSGEAQKLLSSEIAQAKSNGITEAPALLINGAQVKTIDASEELISSP